MTRKEDINVITNMVNNERLERTRRLENERIMKERTKENQRLEEQRLKDEAENRLKVTGVVDLFQQIRDEGIVNNGDAYFKIEKGKGIFGKDKQVKVDFRPAEVKLCGNNVELSWGRDSVFAYFNNDLLIVEGRNRMVVDKDLALVEAVGRALISPHYEEELNTGGDYN